MSGFLPMTKAEIKDLGWDSVDFVCVTGDAYVDHPSFGIAIISRILEREGYRVAILAQPNVKNTADFTKFGRPNYGFMVTGGNVDSMVSNYSVAKKKRSKDAYSPGGVAGRRPDRALTVYCNKIREAYPDIPIVIGGLEASLRRFAHYDYWDECVKPSVLVDTKADILSYGMGEHQTVEIAKRLSEGEDVSSIRDIRGICYLANLNELPENAVSCASFAKVSENKESYARACKIQMDEQDAVYGRPIVQKHGDKLLVQTPPALPLEQDELDRVYEMPFMKMYHPSYESQGGVPAIEEVEFSLIHNRGCFGNCNFCSIALHQGRRVTCRSEDSVVEEAEKMVKNPRFKGYIHDVGGPTANFRGPSCQKQLTKGLCRDRKCLAPTPCPALNADESEYLHMLRRLRKIKGVKKVFIRSGIRYDYMMKDKSDEFMHELIEHHVSGQLKVAPEHCVAHVLDKMGKPHIEVYKEFSKKFFEYTAKIGKEQYLVPYLISSHPGCTLKDAITLAVFLKRNNLRPEQVQDFYPTPSTISTCMFYTGIDPMTMKPVYVPKDPQEKAMQRALLQYFKPENRQLVMKALIKAGREDLIGNGPDCLIPHDKKSFEQSRIRKKYVQNDFKGSRNNSQRNSQRPNKAKKPSRYAKGTKKQKPKNKG